MTAEEQERALAVVRNAYPICADADEQLLEAIAAAVAEERAAERERCAQVAEEMARHMGRLVQYSSDPKSILAMQVRQDEDLLIAAVIRAAQPTEMREGQ